MSAMWFEDEQLLHSIYHFPHLPVHPNQESCHISNLLTFYSRFLEESNVDPCQLPGDNRKIWWLASYGCACIVNLPSDSSVVRNAHVELIVLDGWSLSMHHCTSTNSYQHISRSKSYKVYSVGEVEVAKVQEFLQFCRAKLQLAEQAKKHQYTSGVMLGLLICRLQEFNSDDAKELPIVPKGESMSCNLHDTAWPLALAAMQHLNNWSEDEGLVLLVQFGSWVAAKQLDSIEQSKATRKVHINGVATILAHSSNLCTELANAGFDISDHCNKLSLVRNRLNALVKLYYCATVSSAFPRQLSVEQLPYQEVASTVLDLPVGIDQNSHSIAVQDLHRAALENLIPMEFGTGLGDNLTVSDLLTLFTPKSSVDRRLQLILFTVDDCIYAWSSLLDCDDDTLLSWPIQSVEQLEQLANSYRDVMAEFMKQDMSAAHLQVALRSQVTLLLWIIYCLIHKICAQHTPLLLEYGVPLEWSCTRHLVLAKKSAWEAAMKVSSYLKVHSTYSPVFSTVDPITTWQFIDKYYEAENETLEAFNRILPQERIADQKRIDSYWNSVKSKRQRAVELKVKIKQYDVQLANLESQRSTHPYNSENSQYYYRRIQETTAQRQQLVIDLDNTQKAPHVVCQPLPMDLQLAKRAVFFVIMPLHLSVLSRFGFVAQQALADANLLMKCQVATPVTNVVSYVEERSSIRASNTISTRFFTSVSIPAYYGPSHIDHLTDKANGIWYPDSLFHDDCLGLYWQGGIYSADKSNGYFDPFLLNQHANEVCEVYTEACTMKWALSLPLIIENDRSNLGISQGDEKLASLRYSEHLVLAALRAYPYSQFRKLCAVLCGRDLPLQDPTIRLFIQMSLFHIGDSCSTNDSKERLLWKDELFDQEWLKVLAVELASLGEDILPNPRDHMAMLVVVEVISFASQWSELCRSTARSLATIIAASADEIMEKIEGQQQKGLPNISKLKPFYLYSYALQCFRGGGWDASDVAMVCQLVVRLRNIVLDEAEETAMVKVLLALSKSFVCQRIHDLVIYIQSDLNILSLAVRAVLRTCPLDLVWAPVSRQQNFCYEASAGGHLYSINILEGIVLFDGYPPTSLPVSVLNHELYRSYFGNRNFEVVRSASGFFTTTYPINGCFYKFSPIVSTNQLVIEEIVEADNRTLQLLDSSELAEWLQGFPESFKLGKCSRWLWRAHNVIIRRAEKYLDKEVSALAYLDLVSNHWICKIVPLHVCQDETCSASGLLELISLVKDQCDACFQLSHDSVVSQVMSKFELQRFMEVHVSQSIAKVSLIRFGLQFELKQDGKLYSLDHAGYYLAESQQFDDTLLGFSCYLVLVDSKEEVKVMFPIGELTIDDSTDVVSVWSNDDRNLVCQAYTYHIHTRLNHFEATSIVARLYLCCLYAATGTLLPENKLNRTGFETALDLLRQCWTNRPLSTEENCSFTVLKKFCLSFPSLSILCYQFEKSTTELSFLYSSVDSGTGSTLPSLDVNVMNYYRTQSRPWNCRQGLSSAEETMVFGKCVRPMSFPFFMMPKYGLKELSPCLVSQTYVAEKEAMLLSFVRSDDRSANDVQFPIPLDSLTCSGAGAALMEDLQNSWTAYHQLSKCELNVSSEVLQANLEELGNDIALKRASAEEFIFSCLNCDTNSRVDFAQDWYLQAMRCLQLSNLAPVATFRDLLSIALAPELCTAFNPWLSENARKSLHGVIVLWLQLCVLEDRVTRLVALCKSCNSPNDYKLISELITARCWDSAAHIDWLVFEVEGQLQIRPAQYRTALELIGSIGNVDAGMITQMNMGEGKTRVILPMLVLYFSRQPKLIVRLHFLYQLLGEAFSFMHRHLCASSINVKLFLLPFNRDVQLTAQRISLMRSQLKYCTIARACVCVSQEQRLSLYLKQQEFKENSQYQEMQMLQDLEADLDYLDVLDESDEILRQSWELVYAVGHSILLPAGQHRWQAAQALLRVIKQCEQLYPDLFHLLSDDNVAIRSAMPTATACSFSGIRIVADDGHEQAVVLCVTKALLDNPPYEYLWLEGYKDQREQVLNFITAKENYQDHDFCDVVGAESAEMLDLLALRGLLAFGIFIHCLRKRHRVNYGTYKANNKRIAVPYRAADTPSQRSEYSHPDIAIMYTILSYYYDGLTVQEVHESVQKLLSLSTGVQEAVYKTWLQDSCSSLSHEEFATVDLIIKIDPSNEEQLQLLHRIFQHNTEVVNFWLAHIVLPLETKQHPSHMTANCWHLCDNSKVRPIGFSGTDDNKLLLPLQVKQQAVNDPALVATNGKMLSLLLNESNKQYIELPATVGRSVWQDVLHLAVESGADALIDAGGLIAGVSNAKVAAYLLQLFQQMQSNKLGVVYYDSIDDQEWKLVDRMNRTWSLQSSPIREADAFVFFDDQHCRGADMKLMPTAKGMLTLGAKMQKDKLMQAAGRMRQLDGSQSIFLVGAHDVTLQIFQANSLDTSNDYRSLSSQQVLVWTLKNTVDAIAPGGLLQWAQQGVLFCRSKDPSQSSLLKDQGKLQQLYDKSLVYDDIAHVIKSHINALVREIGEGCDGIPLPAEIEVLFEQIDCKVAILGAGYKVSIGSLDEECEREQEEEVEEEREVETEREMEMPSRMSPVPEVDWSYKKVLTANERAVLLDSRAKSMEKQLSDRMSQKGVKDIAWSDDVYLTHNFMHTVQLPGSTLRYPKLDGYLRLADAFLVFPSGKVLLLSEREADEVLIVLQNAKDSCHAGVPRLMHLNFARLGHVQPDLYQMRFEQPMPAISVSALVSIQLYNGEVTFATECQKTALIEMLSGGKEACVAAVAFPLLRDKSSNIIRSDLETAAKKATARMAKGQASM